MTEQQEKVTTQEKEEIVLGEDGKPLSKKQLRKLEKKKEKEQQKQKKHEKSKGQATVVEEDDYSKSLYGTLELIQSKAQTNKKWVNLNQINDTLIGKEVLIRARVSTVRGKGKIVFVVLRQSLDQIQCVASQDDKTSKQMIKFISNITKESIIDLEGIISKPEKPIESCNIKYEITISKIMVVSLSQAILPFQIEDANRPYNTNLDEEAENEQEQEIEESKEEKKDDKKKIVTVSMKKRLDFRYIDLRTQTKQAIFRIETAVVQLFREFLYKHEFVEIHSPKIIPGVSEGGTNVFPLQYFGQAACLSQSPQLYKQMAIMGDFQKVFEIGDYFRAEKARTHRHLTEFIGLDLEMTIKEHYFELMDFMADMFFYIFENLEGRFSKELNIIAEQFPCQKFKFKKPVLKFTFQEICEQLKKETGYEHNPTEDFDTIVERKIGQMIKEKYDCDFYFIHRYPISARPFYTMLAPDDSTYTLSYDFFMRGEEITSGSQRVHDAVLLEKRAKECGIDTKTMSDYIDSFKYGAYPHGGCGIGLARVVMLYCDLKNLRNSSMFPRDTKRCTP